MKRAIDWVAVGDFPEVAEVGRVAGPQIVWARLAL